MRPHILMTLRGCWLLACVAAPALHTQAVYAQAPAADAVAPIFNTATCAPDGIALGGYDPVSYHRDAGPLRGDSRFSLQLGNLTYLFASEDNLNTFRGDRQRYLPTYLGWCSATLSMGRLACPDYANFKIENGRLLLFERVGFTNGRDMWNADPLRSKQQADKHFLDLSQQ